MSGADLGDFLQRCARQVRVPGEWDCCAMPAAWALELCGRDPMAEWRGAYRTDNQGDRLADDAGGLAVLFARGFGSIGWQPVTELRAGDIGVIKAGGLQAGGIFAGERWAFAANRGIGFAHVDPEHVAGVWGWRDHG